MCILHALMCIGCIVANDVHSLCVGQDPAVIVEVAQILRDYKTGITPKGKAEPDGEESWRLLVAWNQLSQVLYIDSSIDAAVKGMSRTLTVLYQTWHDSLALQIREVARAFRSALCPTSPSPGFFLYDCKHVVQNIKPYGTGMFCGDLLESANAVFKDMHNNYSNRAGGRGAKIDLPEASLRVVQQCQNRIALRTELPRWLGKTKAQEVHVAQVVNADRDSDSDCDG